MDVSLDNRIDVGTFRELSVAVRLFGPGAAMSLPDTIGYLFCIILLINIMVPYVFFALLPWADPSGKQKVKLPPKPQWTDVKREICWGVSTAIIFAPPFGYIAWLFGNFPPGFTCLYLDTTWNLREILYWPLSIFIYMVIHDTYFYWSHLLMHRSKLVYDLVHKVHHMSRPPTPWSNFSFSPLEALVQCAVVPLCCLYIPIHCSAMLVLLLIMSSVGTWHHTQHEILPDWVTHHWLFRLVLIDVKHHTDHHSYYNCNYGLYFVWWDKLMGTYYAEDESVSPLNQLKQQLEKNGKEEERLKEGYVNDMILAGKAMLERLCPLITTATQTRSGNEGRSVTPGPRYTT
eukprot:g6805.t1